MGRLPTLRGVVQYVPLRRPRHLGPVGISFRTILRQVWPMRSSAVLIPLLLSLFLGPALAETPDWWCPGAVWAGDGIQDGGQRWSVKIALEGKGARISYPSIPCGGTLDILTSTAEAITLRETITTGQDLCVTGGTLVLRVEAGGSLLFNWSDPASGQTATAILAPPVS